MKAEHINPFLESVCEMFTKMLGTSAERGDIGILKKIAPSRDIVAMIGLSDDARTRIGRFAADRQRDRLTVFREFALFKDFSDPQLSVLLDMCFSVNLRRGVPFYYEGVSDDLLAGLFIVESGLVRIFRKGLRGDEETLWTANAGQLFGEMSLFSGQPHSASIRAVNDSHLVGLASEALHFLQTHYPPVAIALMHVIIRSLCNRLGRTTRMLFSPSLAR